jgi:hypothetical protein
VPFGITFRKSCTVKAVYMLMDEQQCYLCALPASVTCHLHDSQHSRAPYYHYSFSGSQYTAVRGSITSRWQKKKPIHTVAEILSAPPFPIYMVTKLLSSPVLLTTCPLTIILHQLYISPLFRSTNQHHRIQLASYCLPKKRPTNKYSPWRWQL